MSQNLCVKVYTDTLQNASEVVEKGQTSFTAFAKISLEVILWCFCHLGDISIQMVAILFHLAVDLTKAKII